MRLQDQILEDLSRNMASAMDRHVLFRLLIDSGWFEVIVDPWQHSSSKEINEWVASNTQGQSMKSGNSWAFEQQADAALFALRWA